MIEAAGGVIVDVSRDKPHYLLIHRPRYDDWTFPKGKLDRGEKHRDAALREVKEETGLNCEVITKLSPTRYRTQNGNPKRVRYWLMRPTSGSFVRNDEVDAVTWLKRRAAMAILTHEYDRVLLTEAHTITKSLR